jgi:receptor protein-tyrosine kinase
MSRNFELMTQLETEIGAPDKPIPTAADSPAEMAVARIPSDHAGDVGGEQMLRFVQRVFLSANGSSPRQVVICGVDGENGSSSICASAARTLAVHSSRPVCLVDANMRSPHLASIFGVDGMKSLSAESALLRDKCVKVGSNLWLAGPNILSDSSRVLLPPVELKDRLAQLRAEFEYLLIDAPGTNTCGDAQLLGLAADAAILVIEANSTRRLTARKAKETLDAAGVRLLGTMLCNRSFPIPGRLYRRI